MCADRGRRPRTVTFETREIEIDEEIAKVFGTEGIVVFRETQKHGRTPDFVRTEEALRGWLDETEEEGEGGTSREEQLKELHGKLIAYGEGTYKFLKTVWDDVNFKEAMKMSGVSTVQREVPLCKPIFVVFCLAHDNVLRKGCLLYCLHKIRAPSWMNISLTFILLADLLRRMHTFVSEVNGALRLSAASYDFIAPPEEEEEEEEGPPQYWWGNTELVEGVFGRRDLRTSLMYPRGSFSDTDHTLPEVNDDSSCSVM